MTQDMHDDATVPSAEGQDPAAKVKVERAVLLAHVAGSAASGIVAAPSETSVTAASIAAIAVDVAEEILKKSGL